MKKRDGIIMRTLAVIAASLAFSAPVSAAYIAVDDSNPDTITILAGQFEYGFWVNGIQLITTRYGAGSITLPDGAPITISGSWVDRNPPEAGTPSGTIVSLLFGPSGGGSYTSGMFLNAGPRNSYSGTLTGTIEGFDPAVSFSTTYPTMSQDGHMAVSSLPYMGISFTSETAPTPEPATMLLFGAGLAGLAATRRKKKA